VDITIAGTDPAANSLGVVDGVNRLKLDRIMVDRSSGSGGGIGLGHIIREDAMMWWPVITALFSWILLMGNKQGEMVGEISGLYH